MKACFLLQRRFAYLGHAMALILQKKYGINEFCGYVETRQSYEFLKSQKDIPYTNLILDEEIVEEYKKEKLDLDYLKRLEKEYGVPNLWPYLDIDRVIRYSQGVREYPYDTPKYTHEEMMRILQVVAKNVINFLEKEKPDFIFFSAIGSVNEMFLYHVAKKMGIKTFLSRTSHIGSGGGAQFTITESYKNLENEGYIGKTFDDIRKNSAPYEKYIMQAEKFLEEFRNKPAPWSALDLPKSRPINRKKQFKFLLPSEIFRSIAWFFKMLYGYVSDKNRRYFTNIKPWHYIIDRIKRKTRVLIGFGDLYDEIDLKEDFAFFPLQLQPEITTMLYAPFYTNHLWLIKQIACSLPIHYKLYVKEHPAMFGYRPRRYYKELKKIPNVKLIRPVVAGLDLIKNAKLITTATSTAGLEAAFFKKPAITFGDTPFNKLSMVKRCRAIEELPQIVKEQIENFHHDEKALVNFIAAVYKESADVNLPQIWTIEGGGNMEKKKEALVPLVDLVAEKMNLQPIKNGV